MISIYLNPDKTQVVRGRFKKNMVLDIEQTIELPSYWQAVLGLYSQQSSKNYANDANTFELAKLFKRLHDIAKYEEIYIVLADSLFSMVSCLPYTADNIITNTLVEKLGGLDEYYLTMPIEVRPALPTHKTVYAIKKKYIDRITAAAQYEHLTITSVEPASMAFVRARMNWLVDYAFVESFMDESTILNFSPIGGVFRNEAPHMGERELLNSATPDTTITKNYSTNTYNCSRFFGSASPDIPYIMLTQNQAIKKIPAIRHNHPDTAFFLPEFVQSDLEPKEQLDWMIVVGGLLEAAPEELDLYPSKRPEIIIHSANLLPQELQAAAKNKQWKQVVKRTIKGVALGLALVLAMEGGASLYFSKVSIDPMLQADYEQAKKDKAVIDGEMNSIKKCMNDDMKVMDTYQILLQDRPNTCGFTKLTIGAKDTGGKDLGSNYIKIRASSSDQLVFNDFIAALQQEDSLKNPVLKAISGLPNGIMNAEISVGKGGKKDD